MAFYPANVTYPSMLGELYSAAFTAPAFNWQCSPAVTELETIVLDWMAQALHLPQAFMSTGHGGGVIQGSASEVVVTVMIAARERYLNKACAGLEEGTEREEKMHQLRSRLVALGNDQSHSSTAKAAKLLGVKCKEIPTELGDALALTGSGYEQALRECQEQGLEPFYVTTTIGTTATCATDRIAEIVWVNNDPARSAFASNPPWIHVDAAYAGAALVCDEHAYIAKDLEHVDSFNTNMHKWLLTNFDASILYLRERRDLTTAMSITRSYLANAMSDSGLVTDYRDWQIPLGRRFRALKIWFVIRTYGVNGLKAHVRRHIDLAKQFEAWIRDRDDLFLIPTPPAFALTVVTLRAGNECSKQVYERINASGQLFITSGVVKGIYALRFVAANENTNEAAMRKAFELLVRISEDVVLKADPRPNGI